MTFITAARVQRVNLKNLGDEVRLLMKYADLNGPAMPAGSDPGEAKANIMLAFRHVEDAAMRLGKAIQAMDGGVSCYNDAAKIAQETGSAVSASEGLPGYDKTLQPFGARSAPDSAPLAQRPACG